MDKKKLRKKTKSQEDNLHAGSLSRQLDLFSFLDSIPHGMGILDSSGRIVVMNRFMETVTGYSREEAAGVLGKHVIRCNVEGENDLLGKSARGTGESTCHEGNVINQSRKKIQVRFTISPLKLQTDNIAGSIVFLEDISFLKELDEKVHGFSGHEKIIGNGPKMQEIFEMLPIAARTDTSLLITGETGTGKDLVAESIHKASNRSRNPFIKVNCGALPESLLESELFGHVRGAFTGADRDRPGMFRLAHGGTIFLTEIGDLSLPLQVKLLTVLDDKEFYPVGGTSKVKVDVRVMAATHRNLSQLVSQGKFREDLYYRLNVLNLHLPPLRDRGDDFRLLLDHFLREFKTILNKKITGFDEDSLAVLSSYNYPGNARELRNIVEYAANVCPGELIRLEHLPRAVSTAPLLPDSQCHPDFTQTGEEAVRDETAPGVVPPRLPAGWNETEKRMVMKALTETGGRRSAAAGVLGWSRSTLWRKIKQHKLE